MFSLENLEVLVEEKLVSLKVLVCSHLSLRVVSSVYQVIKNQLFAALRVLTFVLLL